MSTTMNGRPRRPQLAETIQKIDDMIDGLATAIPGAVADSVREVLAAVLPDAIQAAVAKATAEFAAALAALPSPQQPPASRAVTPEATAGPGRVRTALVRLRNGITRAGRRVAHVVAGCWSSAVSCVRRTATAASTLTGLLARLARSSPRSTTTALLAGAAAGVGAYHLGTVGAAAVAGLGVCVLVLAGTRLAPLLPFLAHGGRHA